MSVRRTAKNTIKGGGTEQRGGDTKILKGGTLGQGVGALKRGGAGTPLQTMAMLFATATELLVRNRMLNQTSFVKGYLTRVVVGRGFGTQIILAI